MARISLLQKIQAMSMIVLEFTDIRVEKNTAGDRIAILTLADVIPNVVGSQRWEDKATGKSGYFSSTDVTEVKVHESNFSDAFQFDENGTSGSYEGENLRLDVAKRSGEVWMVETPFSQAATAMRTSFRNKNVEDIINKQLARQGANTPGEKKVQPVETEA